jgi:hypothetical protein
MNCHYIHYIILQDLRYCHNSSLVRDATSLIARFKFFPSVTPEGKKCASCVSPILIPIATSARSALVFSLNTNRIGNRLILGSTVESKQEE